MATPQTAMNGIYTLARLKPGVTRAQAEAELRTIKVELNPQQAEFMNRFQPVVPAVDFQPDFQGRQRYRAMEWTAVGAVSFLYLIACVNAGGLMLVRAISRKQKVGIRLALGAGRCAPAVRYRPCGRAIRWSTARSAG